MGRQQTVTAVPTAFRRQLRSFGGLRGAHAACFDPSFLDAFQLRAMAFYLLYSGLMIRMSLQLTPPAERWNELLSAFRLLAARAEIRPGCLDWNLEEDKQKQGVLIYHEDWDSWRALEAYIRSDSYLRILQLMEISVCTPVLRFKGPGRICGLELVHELRNNAVNNHQ